MLWNDGGKGNNRGNGNDGRYGMMEVKVTTEVMVMMDVME